MTDIKDMILRDGGPAGPGPDGQGPAAGRKARARASYAFAADESELAITRSTSRTRRRCVLDAGGGLMMEGADGSRHCFAPGGSEEGAAAFLLADFLADLEGPAGTGAAWLPEARRGKAWARKVCGRLIGGDGAMRRLAAGGWARLDAEAGAWPAKAAAEGMAVLDCLPEACGITKAEAAEALGGALSGGGAACESPLARLLLAALGRGNGKSIASFEAPIRTLERVMGARWAARYIAMAAGDPVLMEWEDPSDVVDVRLLEEEGAAGEAMAEGPERMAEYLVRGRVRQGIPAAFAARWARCLHLQKEAYGRVTDRFPENLLDLLQRLEGDAECLRMASRLAEAPALQEEAAAALGRMAQEDEGVRMEARVMDAGEALAWHAGRGAEGAALACVSRGDERCVLAVAKDDAGKWRMLRSFEASLIAGRMGLRAEGCDRNGWLRTPAGILAGRWLAAQGA